MARLVLAHGLGLVALALLVYRLTPQNVQATLIAGLVGGGLCILWGTIGLFGYRRRTGLVLTLAASFIVLTTQAVGAWTEGAFNQDVKILASILITLMMITCLGLLLYVIHRSEPGETTKNRQVI